MEPILYQATVEADAAAANRILEAFEAASDPSASAVGMFERGPDRFEVFAYYNIAPTRTALLQLLEGNVGGDAIGELRIERVENADWVTLSQGRRPAVKAGRFFVHGSHDKDRAPQHRFVVKIDAGQAFGTAHHASTQGCLMALDDLLKRRRPRRILDLGTGSGILAIAAAHATKRNVLASDSDAIAVRVAAGNARANCALPAIRLIKSEGFAQPQLRGATFDLILANLLARTHYDLAPDFAGHLVPGGVGVLSGLTQDQSSSIEARFRDFSLVPTRRIVIDGWTTLVLTRR